MKKRYKSLLLLLMVAAIGLMYTSCSDDDGGGNPQVFYVRVTNPAASDSLLTAAFQGSTIAIVGENLGGAIELWFNDQPAELSPAFITDKSIIVAVPSDIPLDINNKMKLVFSGGKTVEHDFEVAISEPEVDRLKSEYVETDAIATIYGNYFYEPVTVTFAGGVQGQILDMDETEIQVIVPEGAQPGPITVTSNFGETESNFWFRDNRNIIASFDVPLVDNVWRGTEFVVASDPAIDNISGKFVRINKGVVSAWPYMEIYGGPMEPGGDINFETQNLPEGALLNPADYSLKFEVNTLASMAGVTARIYLGTANSGAFGDARNNIYYIWNANENTNGDWQTVTIPWNDVYEANARFDYSDIGYAMYIYFHGPNSATYNFAFDNIRVVPNTSN